MRTIFVIILIIMVSGCWAPEQEETALKKGSLTGYWYQHPLRIQQTVLRQTDAINYQPDSVVAYLKKIHANVLVINGGGVVDFFQNKLPLANVNPFLKGRDLLEEVVTACHAQDIQVIARVDFRGVEKKRYLRHPDWFGVDENGQPLMLTYTTPEMYAPCYNSYYRNEHAVEFLSLLLEKYKVDGIWHNAVNFHQTCYCTRCREKFRAFSGKKIPGRGSDPRDWEEYYRWKAVNADEQLTLMQGTVKKYGQDKAYTAEVFNMFDVNQQKHTGIDLYSAAKFFDFLVTVSFIADNRTPVDYKELSYGATIIKFLKSLRVDKSPVILFGGNGTEHRYIYDPPIDLRQWLWEASGSGGGFWNCYFNGAYPAVTLDVRNAYLPEDAYAYQEKNEGLIQQLEPVKDVAVYYSKTSAQLLGDHAFSLPIRGMIRMLHDAHFQYGYISDYDLTREALDHCQVLILPNVACMDESHAGLIRDWVNEGGKLIATFETSLYDDDGRRRDDFLLSDLFGCHFTGETANTDMDCYQKVVTRNELLKGFEKTSLLHNGGETLLCTPVAEAVTLTGYLPKINNQPPENAFPETWDSEYPILLDHPSGAGRAIYFANQPGLLNQMVGHPDYHQLLVNAVKALLGNRISLTTNAPASVHIYLNRDRKTPGRFQLSLVNTTSAPARPIRNLIPVRDIEIRFPTGISSGEIISGNETQVVIQEDRLQIDQLDEYFGMVVELEEYIRY
jgi:hypothetical protein